MDQSANIFDRLLGVAKWPIALASLAILPFAILQCLALLTTMLAQPVVHSHFLVGFLAYLTAWQLILKKQFTGSLFSTLEHELTHGIFALVTLHPIRNIRATWNDGGEIQYLGGDNWLIKIAPYFFPTLSVIVILLMQFEVLAMNELKLLLGVTTAYHVTSTWTETHRQQSDLQFTGFLFAWMFLPTANLVFFGFISLTVIEGSSNFLPFINLLLDEATNWLVFA